MIPDSAFYWITHYGNGALFFALVLGIIGLPIPDETLLYLAGYFICKGKLAILPTVFTAITGSICGISLSYLLGLTAGNFLAKRYGRWVGINEQRIISVAKWFERIGKWTLLVGYFIPGVRHLAGYVAGTVSMHYKQFAIFAYSGAVLWSCLFLAIGYFLHA